MKLMEFLDKDIDVATAITGSYDPILVTFSFCVVCMAVYSALNIGERAQELTQIYARKLWLTWGAIALGTGIWAMHFIGMHAFELPVAVYYDFPLTLLSVIPAIISGGIMLWAVGNSRTSGPRLILGGTLAGLGIGLMHYTGMAAMHADARMVYDLPLFIVSVIVAVLLSIAALYLHHRINNTSDTHAYWSKFASTLVLGLAVTAMHYTAMAATYFFPAESTATMADGMSHIVLHTSISVVIVLIISLAFLTTIIDTRLIAIARLRNEIAEQDRQVEIVRIKNLMMDNILNGIHDYYLAVESDWRICYVNNRARDLLNGNDKDIKEIIGKVLWDVAPELASFSYKKLVCVMANREEDNFELFYPPDGRWFHVHAMPTGEGIAVYLHDTTENKQLIDSLSQNEQRFLDFAEVAADWFWEMDENLRFSDFSGGMHINIGSDRHLMIGKTRWELSLEDTNNSKWIQHKEDLTARRPFHDFRYQFQKSDGSVYHWSISGKPIYDTDGRFTGYRGTGTDITGEIVAQQARKESEDRFKNFAETAADWFWEMDENLCFSYFSERFKEISGVAPSHLLGKSRRDLAHEDVYSKKWQKHFADLDARRQFRNFSYRTKRPDGATAYWSVSGTPVFYEDGRFKGYQGTGKDITPEIMANKALEESEQRFKDFADCGADWFWEMDANLRFNYFSGHMHQITGIDPVNFIGKTRRDLAHENTDDSKWQAHLADLEAHRPFHDFRYKARRADGVILNRTNSGKPIFDADGKFAGYRGVSADITAEIKAEEALRQSEERFKDFAEVAADWFWEMDANLRFNYFSGRMLQVNGIDPSSILGKKRQELTVEDTNDSKWQAHLADLEAHRPFHDFRYKAQRADGTILYRTNSGKPIFDADGKFTGYRGSSADITAEINAQEALQESEERFKDFAETAADWFWEMDENLRFSSYSDRFKEISGVDPKDLLGKTRRDLAHEDVNTKKWQDHFADLDAHRPFRNFSYLTKKPDGATAYWSVSGIPVFYEDGKFKGYHGTGRDITPEILAQLALQNSEERFKDFAEVAADWFWEMDKNLRFNYFSGRMHEVTGVDPNTLLGKTRRELARENTNDSKWQGHFADLEAHRPFHDFRYKTQRNDGAILHWTTSGKPIFDPDGKFTGYRGVSADVTAEYQAKEALQESEERFKDFAETAADWFWEMDENLRFTRVEGNYMETMGVSKEDLIGKSRRELYANQINDPRWAKHLEDLDAHRPFADFEVKWIHPVNKQEKIYLLSGKPFYNSSGLFQGYRGVGRDITEEHALSTQLTYQASHDTLTGLINRRELELRLQRALESTKKDSAVHALCYLDLDQFKVVNDTCGHVAGDELLRQLAKVLPKCVRQQDTVARLGGDEFGVLLEHCSKEQALRVAEAMRRMVSDFIFLWQDKTFNIGVSIGLVSIAQATDNFNTLLSAADNACYAAKDLGRNRIHVYDETDAGMVRRHGDMQWVTRIHEAIEENRFELAFQPIVSVVSFSPGQNSGWNHYELLLRMRDNSGKIIAPGAFLPAAERYNLVSKLDRWVISTAIHWLVRHPTHLKQLEHCSINLSGQSFGNKEFLNFVLGIFNNGDVPPEKICFEITETSAISDLAGAIDFIKSLREIGCLFSLDDFGSGLSSFGYLKNLPVDFIKIDGLFVKDIVENPISYSMVKSINEIGHVMGKKIVAEFVENEAILSKLREIGVDYAQGYGICKPQALDEVLAVPVRKNLKLIQARGSQSASPSIVTLPSTKQKK